MTTKMVVNGNNTEFGYSLIATIPYAYALHKKGLLDGTVDAIGSEPLYYFSPDHQIDPRPRDFANTAEAAKSIPNMWIHRPSLDKSNWEPPPYREHFGPNAIRFDKPTVVIYNRYNEEWGKPPINFFDLDTLRELFFMLLSDYEIVYFNVSGEEDLEDNAHSLDLGDYEMIRRDFPSVRIIHDLVREYGSSYNDVQLRVFAGCERFITMNGGPSILASYFGGENIIYTRECREIRPSVNSFYNWYPDFGGSTIKVVYTHADLIRMVQSKWVDEEPLINILVRCSRREAGLQRLFDSITSQTYLNWRVICSYEDEETMRYLRKYPCDKVLVTPPQKPDRKPEGDDYKAFLGANEYLNTLASRVTSGYITYMDDDDYYADTDALSAIASAADPDKVLIWKAATEDGKRVVPSARNWGRVVAGDISGIAFAFHHKHIDLAMWEPWRRGDFRVIRNLHNHIQAKWISKKLSIIGEQPPEKATSAYISKKVEEHQRKVEAINKAVSSKIQERTPSEVEPAEIRVCGSCGQELP